MIDPEAYRLREDKWTKQNQGLMAAFALVAVAVLIIGLTLTWFVGNQSASTVAKVSEPSNLRILGPNATTVEQLDLSYDSSSVSDGAVTVRRGFCVESGGDPFELQVANTTNIDGLDIHVYRVTVNSDTSAAGDVVEAGSYSWTKNGEVTLAVINDSDSDGVANTPSGNNDQTFGDYTDVQANAAPLYRWKSFAIDELDQDGDAAANVTNFIIEATWTEAAKEADVVYLIARNTSTSSSN